MKPWKLQKFAGDVVYDLRSRGLLPVAIILLVGMVAVPLYISKASKEAPPPAATPAANASELAPENQAAVLAYDPGVRDYRERLNDLATKNPFVQQFAAPAVDTTSAETAAAGVSGADTGGSSTGSGSTGSGSTGSGKSGGSGGKSGKSKTRYYFYETDVEVGEAGGDLDRKNGIDPFDYLPSLEVPVVVFLGTSSDGKTAIFLVSKDVLSLTGSGECFPSAEACQLLGLRSGESEDMVWGIDSKTYRVKVREIDLKVSSKPPKG